MNGNDNRLTDLSLVRGNARILCVDNSVDELGARISIDHPDCYQRGVARHPWFAILSNAAVFENMLYNVYTAGLSCHMMLA